MNGQSSTWRLIGGIAAGIIVAGFTVGVCEWIGHQIFPPPAGFDVTLPANQARMMEVIPFGAKVAVLIAWFAGSLTGALAGVWIARRSLPAFVIAGFIIAGGIASMVMIPHPWWMMAGGIALPIIAAGLVARRVPAA